MARISIEIEVAELVPMGKVLIHCQMKRWIEGLPESERNEEWVITCISRADALDLIRPLQIEVARLKQMATDIEADA